MDRIETNNVFRAAYLLTRPDKDVSLSLVDKGEKRFIVEGDTLFIDDLKYHCGKASVNPLVFERMCRYLERSGSSDSCRFPLDQRDALKYEDHVDDDDIDLLADDLESGATGLS